ncbi:retrovirus-related pol polyprotein from transposon TNT 1-94 [Tanacetum coccineum]
MDSIILIGQKNTLAEYMILSGADNRPSMLDKDLTKKYAELSATEKIQADCDLKATNIILQGLPSNIYSLVNHHRVAKDLWEKVQLLMQGESIHQYYLRFTQLINDMNIYKLKMEQFQVNTKFLNSLPPEWSKFVTDVKLVKDLHTTNFDQLHANLEQHELYANEVHLMHERTKVVLMANLSSYGSDVLSEVRISDNTNNDMLNQSVQEMLYSEPSHFVEHSENEIHSDSNIIMYSQYLTESQNAAIQDTNSFAQQDALILSVFKQLSNQEKEAKNIDTEITLEKKVKELDNIVCKMGQSTQTVHMLMKPQVFNENNLKQALGFQNPFYLKKAQQIRPMLYDGNVIAKETNITPDALKEGKWRFEHTKAVFLKEIVPFLKTLKDIFNVFDKDLLNEKQFLIDNDWLLDQIISRDIVNIVVNSSVDVNTSVKVNYSIVMNDSVNYVEMCNKYLELEAELIKQYNMVEKDEYNKVSKRFSELEQHCISIEIAMQLNKEFFHKSNTFVNQTEPSFDQLVKKDIDETETINIELEHRVTKLIAENGHLKQTFKQLYDSIKPSSVRAKEHVESLVNQLNQKSVEITDLNAQLQEKVFVITTLKNDLRKFKGKDIVNNAAQDKNNRETHEYYLKHTMEQAAILRGVVEQAKLRNPLDSASYSACMYPLKFEKDHLCSACAMGKSKKQSHKPKSEDTNQEKLYLIHMDLCGPMRVASVNGKKYILVIVDDYSRFTWVKFLASKDKAPDFIIKFLKMIQVRLNATVRNIHTDIGTEFVNQTLRGYYEQVGISHETSVELHNKMVLLKGEILLHDRKPDLSHLHVFGSLCYPNNDSENLDKLQAKADIGIFIGYAPKKKAYHIYNRRLVPNPPPSALFVPPSRHEWDLMFQPVFDEFFSPPASVASLVPVEEAPAPVESTGLPSSTTVDQDAPFPSTSQTTPQSQSQTIPLYVEEESHDFKVAHMSNDPYFGILIPKTVYEESSSSDVISTTVHPYAPFSEHLSKWTKDHPLQNIIGDPSRPVSTRLQLHEQALFCYYDAFLTSVEPKTYKDALTFPSSR